MRRTIKLTLGLLFFMLVCVVAACFCACSGGTNGKNGANGKSAYEIWLDEGHTGSQSDFLNWLKGSDGSAGTGENGQDGKDGQNGKDGTNGVDGKSAYQIWLDNGHNGTESDFLEWLKGADGNNGNNGTNGVDGKSAYEIFMQQYPYYEGTEEQWLIALVNGQLRIQEVTFKSEVTDDIVKYVIGGYTLTDIPEVPEKEGQTSAVWDVTDFSNVTEDLEVTAVYDMRKYVTFHNEFTEDEDVIKVVNYNEALTDIPTITAKAYNDSKWSVTDFGCIKTDLQVEAVYETQGLQYVLINQQTEYRVSKGNMNTQTEELFIPAEYNGKPVTVIDTEAFRETIIKFAYIPDSVVEMRKGAFYFCRYMEHIIIPNTFKTISDSVFWRCDRLKSITIPNSVTTIEDSAFRECYGLTSITIPDSITSISSGAFYDCNGLTSITIPDSVTSIGSWAFNGCSSLTSITIPDSVTSISFGAFENCNGLTSITIPDSVTSIGNRAFYGCSNLEAIYFNGTETEFSQIAISSDGNEAFTDATVYYYSEKKPTADGFYWHYDTDGVTPIIWTKEI